ncbi:sacsin N-terminal ATP-binding-like domain-containing protein [Flammeovirga sp. OC4]|uniref:sacsin N-terminal ATP-binding-like domain-containing protein n=1 Tax=Flammeovirga sp. OC4 TaxID=1382345 RepID=UPI0005C64536|nr:hypothetical protein [Flammeovirga sp. OC4]
MKILTKKLNVTGKKFIAKLEIPKKADSNEPKGNFGFYKAPIDHETGRPLLYEIDERGKTYYKPLDIFQFGVLNSELKNGDYYLLTLDTDIQEKSDKNKFGIVIKNIDLLDQLDIQDTVDKLKSNFLEKRHKVNKSTKSQLKNDETKTPQGLIQFINQQNSDYNSPESSQNIANSLNSLSSDIYTDSKRFIYELLQNADDSSNNSGKLEVLIQTKGEYLTISHNGEKFSSIDIESICSVGDGNKKGDDKKTGFKGIGFKSVFSHSTNVSIITGDYCFRFDKTYWDNYWKKGWGNKKDWLTQREAKNKEAIVKMPWQIIPIWSEVDSQFSHLKEYNVSTVVKLDSMIDNIEEDLKELFSDTQILLFLRSKEVSITIDCGEKFTVEKVHDNEVLILKKDGDKISEWLFKSFDFEVDQDARNQMENDNRIPKKLREATNTEISFALKLEEGVITKVDSKDSLVFTYLPTSVNLNFPFLVNANFLTDAGRQNLHQDLFWNKWIFKHIPLKLFSWLEELGNSDYKHEVLRIIPNNLSNQGVLGTSFNKGFEEGLSKSIFIPVENQLLNPSEVIYDQSGITEFLPKELIVDFINSDEDKEYTLDSFTTIDHPIQVMRNIGIKIFSIDDNEKLFKSSIFKEQHKLEDNFDLLSFLQGKSSEQKDDNNEWDLTLKKTTFIFDENENLKTPEAVYFPSDEFSSEDFNNRIPIIHQDVMSKINGSYSVKQWLTKLGVSLPSDIALIEKTIINSPDFVTKENAIKIGQFLFQAFKNGSLKENHLSDLNKLNILTTKGNILPASETYLCDEYKPEFSLEKEFEGDFYVSFDYVENNVDLTYWKAFFEEIGISQNIRWNKEILSKSEISNRLDYTKVKEIFKDFESKDYFYTAYYSGNVYSYNPRTITVHNFSFMDKACRSYESSKLYWSRVFEQEFELNNNITSRGSCGFHHNVGRSYKKNFNYFKWILTNLKVFPSSLNTLERADTLYINNPEIINIASNYLPILDYDGILDEEWKDILPLKKSLDLDDYLEILKKVKYEEFSNKEILQQTKKIIAKVYSKIAENYLGYKDRLIEFGKNNKLLSIDNTFIESKDLSIVLADGFKAPNLAFTLKDEKVYELLELFGVNVIKDISAKISSSRIKIEAMRHQLVHLLPHLTTLRMEGKANANWIEEYEKLSQLINEFNFYQTEEIVLTYGNDEDTQERSSWVEKEDKNFYWTGDWSRPRILAGLVEPLAKLLKLNKSDATHLQILLPDSFEDGMEYLKEIFGKEVIDKIPEEYLHPKTSGKVSHNAPVTGGGYDSKRADIGNKGELFVYKELKKIYQDKYETDIAETDKGFKISDKVDVTWKNIGGVESGADHDFVIEEEGGKIYMDSKATVFSESREFAEFKLTPNEYRRMSNSERYMVARVTEVESNPQLKLIGISIEKLN